MKVLLIEDDDGKSKAIISYLKSKGVVEANILHAKNMTDFAAFLHDEIGLFIIDFKLPSVDNGVASQNGKAILETIIKAGKQDALLLAISSYPQDFPELRDFYESNGCILADFTKVASWQSTLDHLLIQLNKNIRFDFVIFCALDEERRPYMAMAKGRQVIRGGMDCWDFSIGGRHGTAILLSHMGLVNAAVTAGVAIERFKPRVVAMSGICGGFTDRAELGQLLVSKIVYEYQSGKWAADGFRNEPYHVSTDADLVTNLRALCYSEKLLSALEKGFGGTRPSEQSRPDVAVFTSGSAVIADKSLIDQLSEQHRKVSGLDMEIYGIQRAAELSPVKPACICAKTVVDLCLPEKNDKLHPYGCFISARFILKALPLFFLNVKP